MTAKTQIVVWLAAALALLPFSAQATEPVRDDQETFLKRGVFADGRVWLLSDAGQLFNIAQGQQGRIREPMAEPVADICRRDDRLYALTAQASRSDYVTLRQRSGGGWSDGTPVALNKDEDFLALICSNSQITLLTSQRLIQMDTGQSMPLSGDLGRGEQTVFATNAAIFIGHNAGEWGGGLQRIDRATGAITKIENKTGDLCDGLLNTDCDPVTGIAVLPWRPDCVAATIGLMHFEGHGRIVSVCDTKVERIYFKQYGERYPNMSLPPEDAYPTIPFYGVIGEGERILVVGLDGLYHLSRDGKVEFTPEPAFETIGGIAVSFALPDVVLVLTDINSRLSVGGSVPMLIER